MSDNTVILGMQWGDEGKGKIVDLLAEKAAAVIRFQGGHNAGHTLIVDGKKVVLRLLPSGAMHPHVKCIIGNGVVLSLEVLAEEIASLQKIGIDICERLLISNNCNLLLPYHVALDQAREQQLGKATIGTTGKGIGPAYEDKVARRGLRVSDLFNKEVLEQRLTQLADYHNFVLENYYQQKPIAETEVLSSLLKYAEQFQAMFGDVTEVLSKYHANNKPLLFESAQGTLLDVDHGTYPYVTSSNTTAGFAATGSGCGPLYIEKVLGVFKAYTTRVGGGPFATELTDEIGKRLAERGHEFGSVTGRPRRCGWLDVTALQRAIKINSISNLCMTKLDVLDGLEKIKICIDFKNSQPVYETLPGWSDTTFGITEFSKLPKNAKQYVGKVEELVSMSVDIISTGPERRQIIRQKSSL